MKILIISDIPHYKLGGGETYLQLLIDVIKKEGWKFDELCLFPMKKINQWPNSMQPDNTNVIFEPSKFTPYLFNGKKKVLSIMGEYDVVINSSSLKNEKLFNHDKHIYIQHNKSDLLYEGDSLSNKIKKNLDRIFLRLNVKGNPLNASKWTMFYSKYDNINDKANAFYAPLPSKFKHTSPKSGRSGALWVGRLVKEQKGIDILLNMSTSIRNLTVVGDGEDRSLVEKSIPNEYVGKKVGNELSALMNKKRVFILTSRWEGAAFVVAEALSQGMAVVMFDTFEYAQKYNECGSVFLYESGDQEGFANKVNEIDSMTDSEFMKMQMESIRFYKAKLGIDKFNKSWVEAIKEVSN